MHKKIVILLLSITLFVIQGQTLTAAENEAIKPDPVVLQEEYEYFDHLSDEFNGSVSDMWLMDYMPWWSDSAKKEKSSTKTRYRFIDGDSSDNQSLQIYVNGENRVGHDNFQPYYLEKLAGPENKSIAERYVSQRKDKNSWNSKFAGFMAGGKNYLNTFRGVQAPIEHWQPYTDKGATTYGYFETRVKFMPMKRGQGIAPAFWFIGMQDDILDRAEVDVFEILDNHTLDFTIHPKGDDRVKKVTKAIKFEEDLSQDYHTYGLLWDETGFSLFVDGKFKFKHHEKIDYRMIPMFSINHHENGWIGSTDNQGHPEERTMDIDYFRVFKQKGQNPEPHAPQYPDMKKHENIAKAAYISLFGLTGKEADETPMQWLNDSLTDQSVKSGKRNPLGKVLEQSVLPQHVYIDWQKPAKFNTIILHAQNAQSSAPTRIKIQSSENGESWFDISGEISIDWKTDSQISESFKIKLEDLQKEALYTRIVILEANMNQGQFGLSEVEIGENIEPLPIEYDSLPDVEKEFPTKTEIEVWKFNESLKGDSGNLISSNTEVKYGEGPENNGLSLKIEGNEELYLPLPSQDGNNFKSDENFSLNMWINPENLKDSTNDQIILAQQTGNPGGRPWLFIYNNSLGSYLGNENTFGSLKLKDNQWNFASVTFEVIDKEKKFGKVSIYLNGELDNRKVINYESNEIADQKLIIGRHKNLKKGSYKGSIDNISLYQTNLTTSEIKSLYRAKGNSSDIIPIRYDVSYVKQLNAISLKIGENEIPNLVLPQKIYTIFEDVYGENVPVKWNESQVNNIDMTSSGNYFIEGVLDLSALTHTTNSKDVRVYQKVHIIEKPKMEMLEAIIKNINELNVDLYTPDSIHQFITSLQSIQTRETLLLIGSFPHYEVTKIVPEYVTQALINDLVTSIEASFDLLVSREDHKDIDWTALEPSFKTDMNLILPGKMDQEDQAQKQVHSETEDINRNKNTNKSLLPQT